MAVSTAVNSALIVTMAASVTASVVTSAAAGAAADAVVGGVGLEVVGGVGVADAAGSAIVALFGAQRLSTCGDMAVHQSELAVGVADELAWTTGGVNLGLADDGGAAGSGAAGRRLDGGSGGSGSGDSGSGDSGSGSGGSEEAGSSDGAPLPLQSEWLRRSRKLEKGLHRHLRNFGYGLAVCCLPPFFWDLLLDGKHGLSTGTPLLVLNGAPSLLARAGQLERRVCDCSSSARARNTHAHAPTHAPTHARATASHCAYTHPVPVMRHA